MVMSDEEALDCKMRKIMMIASPKKEEAKNESDLGSNKFGESVLYMGRVFAVYCPKFSISSRYRGYSLRPTSEKVF